MASRNGFCCLFLLTLAVSLLPWQIRAEDLYLPVPGTASNSPEITLTDSKDPPQEGIVYGPPISGLPRSAFSGFAPCCPDGCLSECQDPSDIAVRFGWWAAQLRGSPWVVGQWQATQSSPFWDIDGLFTNGVRTFNYSATGTDNESTKANLQYYGPNSQGSISFNRFIHAQEHQSLDNMKDASTLSSLPRCWR